MSNKEEEEEEENEYPILGVPYNQKSTESELDRAFDYLKRKSDNIPSLVDGPHGYKPIKTIDLIHSRTFYNNIPNRETLYELNNYFEIYANILAYIITKLDEIDFKKCSPNEALPSKEVLPSLNERRIYILADLLDSINRLLPISMKARLFFLEKNRLVHFIHIITNENFIVNAVSFDFMLLRSVVFDINWLSKSADLNKLEWRQLNAIPALLNLLKRTAERLKIYIYMACANIADDKEIEEIPEVQASIETFVGFVNQTANELTKGSVQRILAQFKDEDDEKNSNSVAHEYEVCYIMDWTNNSNILLTGSLLAIYRLSINPKSKWAVWTNVNFKQSLKTILSFGNDIEMLYSIQVLAQLAFDEQILKQMLTDKEFIEIIKKIAHADATIIHLEKLRKIAKQIWWSFEESNKKQNPTVETEKNKEKMKIEEEKENNKHIMISYNTGSRDLCLKIKEELEKANHKIWIDVNEIYGSSLDSMARAVENSKCILMCVTEKYRQSLNCQAEAQYSFRLNKTIIPVIMQKGYHNVNGWLGFIIGDKIFVDFTKYSFEDSVQRLKNQINLLTNKKNIQIPMKATAQNTSALPPPSINNKLLSNDDSLETKVIKIVIQGDADSLKKSTSISNKIEQWTESDVSRWFKEINLDDSLIHKKLWPCTGELLSQLHQIQLYAPEFFYKSITNLDTKMEDINKVALFAMNLKKLFQS